MHESFLISVPFGSREEERTSRRYFWDNTARDDGPFVILQWSFAGEGFFEWNGIIRPVPTDHAFIAIAPERSSYGYPAGTNVPWRFGWVNFYGDFSMQIFRAFRDAYGPVLPLKRRSSEGATLLRMIDAAALRKVRDPLVESAQAYQFLMDWARLLQSPRGDSDPVEMAKRICETRFHEPLGVKELADQTGLTREHFTRLFTAQTGVPPALYLRQLRIKAARRMLKTTSRSETALRCGFPSVRALNRALASSNGRLGEPSLPITKVGRDRRARRD